MADSMNFGPEWLRNLSSEGSSSGPKYQLAEFRYGREEMLALFDRTAKPPDNLARLHDLYVDKTQSPVSLLPMTEDENKLWNRGINSELVMRPGGKAPPPGLPGASLRGRGGSIDRGRGRGRGFFYSRPGYDDSDLLGKDPTGPFLRSSRSFDRNPMTERGWPERNGGDPADWNGSTSPRKDYSGLGAMVRGGQAGSDSNWRRNRGGGAVGSEDDEGWRREKWSRSSWREEGTEPPEGGKPPQGGPLGQGGRSTNWGRGWVDEGIRGGRGDQDYENRRHEDMPEWAHADHHEPSGSFDSSGAFHGSCSDEDEAQGDSGGLGRQAEPPAESAREAPPKQQQQVSPPAPTPQQPEKSASSAALSDAQSLDRIRAQHQNFVTKGEPKEPPVTNSPAPNPINTERVEDTRPSINTRGQALTASSAPTSGGGGRENKEPPRQGSEDDMSRLTVDSVVRLIEDEERTPLRPPTERDIWYYRDPNGTEQGPFQSSEMLSWYNGGYFQDTLLVRRDHEERYIPLGSLTSANGRVPFFPSAPPPPSPAGEGFPFHLLGQMQRNVKLPDAERWSAMTQAERDAIMRQKLVMSQQTPVMDPMARLLTQLQQTNMSQATMEPMGVDPVRALMMMGPQAPLTALPPPAHHLPHPALQHPTSHSLQNMNSVLPGVAQTDLQALLRKAEATKAAQQRPMVDSLWSGPGRPAWTNGLANAPTGIPVSVPNSHGPRWQMKTEDDILAEQQKQLQQQQRLAEEKHKREEEERRYKEEEERVERDRKDLERQEEERRRKEEESLRVLLRLPLKGFGYNSTYPMSLYAGLEAPQPSHLQLQKVREMEEEGKKRLEEQRRKLEEMKRLEEAQKKKEEKERKKEEERERKRLLEEEKKRQEEERKRQEKEAEEVRRQEEMILQQQEQQRRQEEALRCLREQQMKTRVKPWTQSTTPSSSLADIQAQEKERKLQQQREQSVLSQLIAAEQLREALEEKQKPASALNLKWASAPSSRTDHVKSLTEIQAEEQIQLAKQLEKERLERQQQQRDLPVNSGIWGGSAGLTWSNHGNGGPWGGVAPTAPPTAGFWDDVASASAKPKAKTPLSPAKNKPQGTNGTKKTSLVNNSKPSKPKAKREEAAVMKLFEPQGDEFTSWCSETLYALQAGIDVPTFSAFLREIESPYEVKDYVKTYLGETREAAEFARNFLERRSRWRAARRSAQDEDDMCAPAVAINPTATSAEALDPARKGKKSKKGKMVKMVKVDTRILGFNVTAAPNRINVGERETWDPNL